MLDPETLKAAFLNAQVIQANSRAGGVIGYGIANRVTGGGVTNTLSLRFCVRKKMTRRAAGAFCIPSSISVRCHDGHVEIIPTDIVELSHIPRSHRNVDGGSSIGHFSGVAGTLGVAVQDARGQDYGLTCAHVAAPWWLSPKGHAIESPAFDDGIPGPNRVGKVENWVVLNATGNNTVDAALVVPDPGIFFSNRSLGLHPGARFSPYSIFDYANCRTGVAIHTRRGEVKGTIEGAYNNLVFDISGKYFSFSNIVCYRAASLPGDSGSAVMNTERTSILGLHFAGEPGAGLGYCVLASNILKAFERYNLQLKP